MQQKYSTRFLTQAAVLAAVYCTLTMVLYAPSYMAVQIRFSEALTVLPFLFPSAVPGLFVGCVIANLISPFGPIDVIFGSLATLLAAYLTSRCKNRWLAPLPPVLCNALIVGATISYAEVGFGTAFAPAFLFNAFSVGAGQLIACYGLGMVLLTALPRISFFRDMISPEKRQNMGHDLRNQSI